MDECRFFEPGASDLLPWQRLNDDDLRTLDCRMLGVLYAEAVARNWIPDTHDSRRNFLAIAFHCATHRRINVGDRTRYFVGRIKKRNRLGLMDAAWDWAGEQLDLGRHPRGAGAHLDAAVKAKRAAVAC